MGIRVILGNVVRVAKTATTEVLWMDWLPGLGQVHRAHAHA